MKAKILGVSEYKQKESGKPRAIVYVQDLNAGDKVIGIKVGSVNCSADVLPLPAKELIGQTYLIDTDGGFGNGFYKV